MLLKWFGHASFLLKTGELTIYIDPYFEPYTGEKKLPSADVILISHWHFDHATLETIHRIRTDKTVLLGTREASSEVFGCHTVLPGEKHNVENVEITIVPAYSMRRVHHPKGASVGFIISAEGKKLYYASDSDYIPEMVNLTADILIVSVGGTYTMKPKEAADAVHTIKPKIAIPMHYGKIEGTSDNAELFKEYVETTPDTRVIIMKEGEEITL